MENFAQRVKQLRDKLGLSQPQLAKKIGTHYVNIANIERGAVENPRYLSKLAEALETTPSFLINGTKSEKVLVDTPVHLLRADKEVLGDPDKELYVISIDKKKKLFLTDGAEIVAKIKQVF
jgi:transcriptional regulator with XRE-family HTH domain|tara:strand:- start:201 stop:563 length:363 start_codon:yes stop_codon:yes gene_type:complete